MESQETSPIITSSTSPEVPRESRCGRVWSSVVQHVSSNKFRIGLVTGLWGFLTGVERAVILPTLWLYFFNQFSPEAATQYYGLTLGAFNVAVLIFSPIYGALSMRRVRVKFLLLLSNQFEIIGNIVYFAASTPWLILLGRFIAGIGAGSEVPLYADVVRVTSKEERTGYIVALLMGRQFGLIIGPAITLVMHPLKFSMGHVQLNVYNSPGLFMAACWALHTCLALGLYVNVNDDGRQSSSHMFTVRRVNSVDDLQPSKAAIAANGGYEELTGDHGQSAEEGGNPVAEQNVADAERQHFAVADMQESPRISCITKFECYFQPVILTLMAFCFATYYSLMALESVLSPVAKASFGWDEVEVSYVYLACGISVILVYGTLRWLSFCVEDRHLLSFGVVVLLIAYSLQFLSLLFVNVQSHRTLLIVLTLVGIALHVIGQPFCIACPESIYTKMVPVHDMDRAQSLLRTIMNIAFVMGPIVGGSLAHMPSIVFFTMFMLILLPGLFFIGSYPRFSTLDMPPSPQMSQTTLDKVPLP